MWTPILCNLALRRISRNVISSLALHIPTPPSEASSPIIEAQASMYADNVVALTKSNEDAHAFSHGREGDLKYPVLVAGVSGGQRGHVRGLYHPQAMGHKGVSRRVVETFG